MNASPAAAPPVATADWREAFDLLATGWTIPWTTLGTVLILWQPFVMDFPHRLQTTTGLTHWWFANEGTVGVLHLVWSVAIVTLVFAVPRPPCRGIVFRLRAARTLGA